MWPRSLLYKLTTLLVQAVASQQRLARHLMTGGRPWLPPPGRRVKRPKSAAARRRKARKVGSRRRAWKRRIRAKSA